MKKKRNYTFIFDGVKFNEKETRGMTNKGEFKNGWISHKYVNQCIKCSDGKYHIVGEHILKWVYFNGEIPEGYEIDHLNGDKQDNRLENLRCVTHHQNCNNKITKANITNALKKHYEENPEDKLRLSKINKGKTPWNKGKTGVYTEETILKMSEVAKLNYKKRDRNEKGQFA